MNQTAQRPPLPAARVAWYAVILLTLAYALAILDRVSISLLIVPLQKALAIHDTQFGLLQGMAFSIVYSLLGLPLGMAVDRRRRVPILVLGLALWSLATVGCSLAQSFPNCFSPACWWAWARPAWCPLPPRSSPTCSARPCGPRPMASS